MIYEEQVQRASVDKEGVPFWLESLLAGLGLAGVALTVHSFFFPSADRLAVACIFTFIVGAACASLWSTNRYPKMARRLVAVGCGAIGLSIISLGWFLIQPMMAFDAFVRVDEMSPPELGEAELGPTFVDSSCSIVIYNDTANPAFVQSNLLASQKFETKGLYSLSKVSFGDRSVIPPTDGKVEIRGDFGTLSVAADGSYEYVLEDLDAIRKFERFDAVISGPDGTEYRAAMWFSFIGPDWLGTEVGDTFTTGAADEILRGNGGNDYLRGLGGADHLYGGRGEDRLWGGDGADFLDGDEEADRLFGDAGDDVLRGETGDDHLIGGDGSDELLGGSGSDTYWFMEGEESVDVIRDFSVSTDNLELTNWYPTARAETAASFYRVEPEGRHTALFVITDGKEGVDEWKKIALLHDIHVDLEALIPRITFMKD